MWTQDSQHCLGFLTHFGAQPAAGRWTFSGRELVSILISDFFDIKLNFGAHSVNLKKSFKSRSPAFCTFNASKCNENISDTVSKPWPLWATGCIWQNYILQMYLIIKCLMSLVDLRFTFISELWIFTFWELVSRETNHYVLMLRLISIRCTYFSLQLVKMGHINSNNLKVEKLCNELLIHSAHVHGMVTEWNTTDSSAVRQ